MPLFPHARFRLGRVVLSRRPLGGAGIVFSLLAGPVDAATYYVRPDGGNESQCSGRADRPFSSTGGSDCAWSHPFAALPPGRSPRIGPGDTLVIADGSYRMGFGAPNSEGCSSAATEECRMPPVPSGRDSTRPTRIVGAGAATGCRSRPELWASEGADRILDLTGARHVEVACLELTDHSGCVLSHTGQLPCRRDGFPRGDWGARGLVATDSADVVLRQLDVHGLASAGIVAGRLRDWLLEDVRVAANGLVGFDGDVDGPDANAGTMTFRRFVAEWNGCAETYPGREITGCWAQSAGGYGDGFGTGATEGEWVFEDSRFVRNTSDGLDLFYLRGSGRARLSRVWAEGNAGNQIKVNGNATIENSVVIGNCGFFRGKSFTYLVDDCRAAGNALSIHLRAGSRVTLVNNTVYSEGDCLLVVGNYGCNGTELVWSRNNVWAAGTDFLNPSDRVCFVHNECPGAPLDEDYGTVHAAKDVSYPTGPAEACEDPRLERLDPSAWDLRLSPESPARDTGMPPGGAIPTLDFLGRKRPDGPGVDRGAYEMTPAERPPAPRAVTPAASRER